MFHNLRRFILVCMVCVLVVPILGCSQAKAKNNQVLMILSEKSDAMEYMLNQEVGVMVELLGKADFKVVTASVSGTPISDGKMTLKPDLKLADVKIEDYAGVIVPCMARNLEEKIPAEVTEVIKKAAEQDKVIAAQMGGVLLLDAAGVLKGKQFTMVDILSTNIQDGIYIGEGIVQDGKIITSGVCPYMARELGKKDGTAELTQKFIDKLKSS
jgi:putative intracellular protease/amidase